MRFLVTGAQGYIGSLVCKRLAYLGITVNTADAGWFQHAYVGEQLSQQRADSQDFRLLSCDDLRGTDVIIHLAGYSNDPMGWLNPQETYDLNETAVIDLARKAKDAGVRKFVFSSTCSVYGESGAVELDETGPTKPLTPYAAAKLGAEAALLSLFDDQFHVAILRGATAFGASPVPRTDLLLNELCAQAACGRPIELQSDGTSWRPFMPADDFARALVAAALDAPQDGNDRPIWNIAPPTMQMTVKEAASRAAKVSHAAPPIVGAQSQPDRRSYRVNGMRFLDAYPRFEYSESFDSQIMATVESYRNIPSLAKDIATERFIRLATFRRDAERMPA